MTAYVAALIVDHSGEFPGGIVPFARLPLREDFRSLQRLPRASWGHGGLRPGRSAPARTDHAQSKKMSCLVVETPI